MRTYLCPQCNGHEVWVENLHRPEPWLHNEIDCTMCEGGLVKREGPRPDLQPWSKERDRGFNRFEDRFRPQPLDPLVTLRYDRSRRREYPATYRVARFFALQDYETGRLP